MKKLLSIVLTLIIAIAPVMVNTETADAKDYYRSFSKLAKHQTRGEDYYINKYDGPSDTAVIAIHAGQIELQTGELAVTIADLTGSDLYIFEGIKNRNNGILHVTSTRFNEPIARNLVAQSNVTLSIHGCKGKQSVTYIGGQDKVLGKKIKISLKDAGFKVVNPPERLDGKNPKNICNKNASGKGVQLELTVPLREQFVSDSGSTDTFYRYAAAISKALEK